VQRLRGLGECSQHVGFGLRKLRFLLIGARPGDRPSQSGEFHEFFADLEDIDELGSLGQEGVSSFAADAPPRHHVFAEFSQSGHTIVNADQATTGEQTDGELGSRLRRCEGAVGGIGNARDELRGISRAVEQERQGGHCRPLVTLTKTAASALTMAAKPRPARAAASSAKASAPEASAAEPFFAAAVSAETGPAALSSGESAFKHVCLPFGMCLSRRARK